VRIDLVLRQVFFPARIAFVPAGDKPLAHVAIMGAVFLFLTGHAVRETLRHGAEVSFVTVEGRLLSAVPEPMATPWRKRCKDPHEVHLRYEYEHAGVRFEGAHYSSVEARDLHCDAESAAERAAELRAASALPVHVDSTNPSRAVLERHPTPLPWLGLSLVHAMLFGAQIVATLRFRRAASRGEPPTTG
jgi:hypothetical protein